MEEFFESALAKQKPKNYFTQRTPILDKKIQKVNLKIKGKKQFRLKGKISESISNAVSGSENILDKYKKVARVPSNIKEAFTQQSIYEKRKPWQIFSKK